MFSERNGYHFFSHLVLVIRSTLGDRCGRHLHSKDTLLVCTRCPLVAWSGILSENKSLQNWTPDQDSNFQHASVLFTLDEFPFSSLSFRKTKVGTVCTHSLHRPPTPPLRRQLLNLNRPRTCFQQPSRFKSLPLSTGIAMHLNNFSNRVRRTRVEGICSTSTKSRGTMQVSVCATAGEQRHCTYRPYLSHILTSSQRPLPFSLSGDAGLRKVECYDEKWFVVLQLLLGIMYEGTVRYYYPQ